MLGNVARRGSGTVPPVATYTFLFTDIEASSRLWEEHPETMRRVLPLHDELIVDSVERRGGRVFKHMGDGAAAAFESASRALEVAADIQRKLTESPDPDVGRLNVRIGVHSGEAEARDGDYFGPTLNRVARLTEAAHGGQVLVSEVARSLSEQDGFEFVDLGRHRLLDLSRPEHIFQLVVDGLRRDFPPLQTLDHAPNNLPTQTTSFIGRRRELAELTGLVGESRLVTVTGVGGIGKTRLALQAAADSATDYPDGMWLVPLGPIADPEIIDEALIDVLGLDQPSNATPRSKALEYLAPRTSLLIVDNCEHLIESVAGMVVEILTAAPGTTVLATSRELLGVPGEVAYGLRSMGLPRGSVSVDDLTEFDAVRLFLERAAAAHPEFRVTSDNAEDVVEICRRLDGMPLAIELAAARLRSFSPAKIAELLDQRFRLLTGGSRTSLPRQQTLAATIEWSYRLLSDKEQALFRRLSVFQGGFTLGAVTEVCTDGDIAELDVLDLVPGLVDKSLVVTEEEGGDRFGLLETIRQFARDRLDESGEGERLRRRHAHYFRDLIVEEEDNIVGPDEVEVRSRVRREFDNVRRAMAWSLDVGEGRSALSLAFGFARFSAVEGRWSEALSWVEQALEAVDDPASAQERAEWLVRHGSVLSMSSYAERAIPKLEEAIEILRPMAADDDADTVVLEWLGRAVHMLAIVLLYQGRAGENNEVFTELVTEMLDLARRAGNDYMEALALANLAHHRDPHGDPEAARKLFAEAEAASVAFGSLHRLAGLGQQRALFEFHAGDLVASRQAWKDAIRNAESAGLDAMAVGFRVGLAICELAMGDRSAAGPLIQTLQSLADDPEIRAHGELAFIQMMLVARAAAAAATDDHADVAVAAGASRAMADRGTPVRWDLLDFFEATVERAAQALGTRELEDHKARGRALSRDELMDFLAGR